MEKHLRYKDRVTIITGGSRGIGFGISKVFVENGAKVLIADIREDGRKVAEELNTKGPGQCMFVLCDISKEENVKHLVNVAVETHGCIDCVINNAGFHPPYTTIDDLSAADMLNLHGINVMGCFLLSKYSLPYLRKTQGNIINNGSLVAFIGQPGAITYVASKGAILSMTKAMAIDEAEHNVRVNSFSPGNIDTPLWREAAMSSGQFEKTLQEGKDAQLIGRFGTLEECGLVCLFLAADATFCTGININVSGGAELNYGHKNRVKQVVA